MGFHWGHLEPNESIEECISRELTEETSMKVSSVKKQLLTKEQNDRNAINMVNVVQAKGNFVAEKDKITEHRWVTQSNLEELKNDPCCSDYIFTTLEEYFNHL